MFIISMVQVRKQSGGVGGLVFLFLVLFSLMRPACAAGSVDRLIRVPVFFITDRNYQPDKTGAENFGPYRKYIGDCKHDPFMGSAYCVVENVDRKPLTDHLKSLGWEKADEKDKEGLFKATSIKGDSFDKIQDEFYGKVHSAALLNDDKNIFVFAHGYKNSFQSALHTAALLAYNAERPLIFYSWPSAARLRQYTTDENNIEWSQEHFNDFIVRLEQMATADPSIKVRLFAHSMGSRLIVRAIPLLREKHYVIETALICPDVDDGLVKHYARKYLSVKGTTEIRLYMSRRDKALAISQLVHGGYTRLGEQADAIAGFVSKTLAGQQSKASAENEKLTHEQQAEFADRLQKTKQRMQTIDFTHIDQGMIGHKVPAKLICSMSFTNAPPPGLVLVQEQSGQRSRMSNIFTKLSKLAKLEDKDDESALSGAVLLVMKEESAKSRKSAKKAKTLPAAAQ